MQDLALTKSIPRAPTWGQRIPRHSWYPSGTPVLHPGQWQASQYLSTPMSFSCYYSIISSIPYTHLHIICRCGQTTYRYSTYLPTNPPHPRTVGVPSKFVGATVAQPDPPCSPCIWNPKQPPFQHQNGQPHHQSFPHQPNIHFQRQELNHATIKASLINLGIIASCEKWSIEIDMMAIMIMMREAKLFMREANYCTRTANDCTRTANGFMRTANGFMRTANGFCGTHEMTAIDKSILP